MKRSSLLGRALSVTLSVAMVATLNAPAAYAVGVDIAGGGHPLS